MDARPAPAEVIGRDGELAGAERFLDAAWAGFAVLRIGGVAGIGKSTVWSEVARRARDRGYLVLASRPSESEARISLAAVADLLEGVPDAVVGALPDPQRHAVEVTLVRADPVGPAMPERVLATAFRSVLGALAGDRPVIMAIDDVQWLDASSADVLAFVARRLDAERVGLLVAHRTGTADPLRADRLRAGGHSDVELGPLTVGALHHVIRQRLGSSLSWSVLGRVHEAAGGNALFALEIARTLAASGMPAPGERLPVPDDVRALVASRVGELPEATREVLLLAAAAGPVPEPRLATLAGRPVRDDLRLAEAQDVIRRGPGDVAFAHPLYADAVYAAAPAEARRAAHVRLASSATDREERARHLALSTTGPDAEVAAALESAGDDASRRGATRSATELLELAARATPPGDEAAGLRRQLRHASLLHAAGDSTRAWERLRSIVAATPRGPRRARALVEQVKVAFVVATTDETLALCEAAFVEAEGDERLRAEAQAILAQISPDPERARDHALAALAALDAMRDPDPHAATHALTALGGYEASHAPDGRPSATVVERALELERLDPLPRVDDRFSAALGVWLKYADDFDGARYWLDLTRRSAVDEGDEGSLPYVYSHLPQLELWTGAWPAAEETALRHLELAEASGQESQRRQALYNLAMVHVHQGREAESRAEIGAALGAAAGDGDTWTEAICLAVLGQLELSLGHAQAAVDAFERVSEIWRSLGDDTPRRHEPELIEALVAVGSLDQAAAASGDLTRRATPRGRHSILAGAARARALVAAARGDGDTALEALAEALRHHDAVDIPFDRARTLLALGVVRRRRRERGLARDALRDALGIFERLGARLWAERTRGELDRLGLRRSPGDELTEGERRVAELAATGRTNREIAAALFMSPKTVDANLGRVYRKLGIGSRAELGAWVAGRQT